MTYIVNRAGLVIRRSRNLRGLLDHARRVHVTGAVCSEGPQGEYLLRVYYANGDLGRALFMDWRVLIGWLDSRRSWRPFEIYKPEHWGSQ